MAACDQVSKFIQRVLIVSGGGGVPIVFPTTLIAKTQTTNALVSATAGAATTVLPLNNLRKFAQIINTTGSTLHIKMGAAASATSIPLPNNSVFTIEPDTIGQINQQFVSIWNPTGGALNVAVYEE